MSTVGSRQPLLPSLLDRLIDHQPDVSTEPEWQQAQTLHEFQQSVLRDVEYLLNTRPSRPDLSETLSEAQQSILTFGMPDFTAMGAGSLNERERLRRAVENTIKRFEPRLRNVKATLHSTAKSLDRKIHFTIEALLWVEPQPVPVSFDTIMEPVVGNCKVESK